MHKDKLTYLDKLTKRIDMSHTLDRTMTSFMESII